MSIAKALDMCYFELFDTALLDHMKDIIKWCYYQKYERGHWSTTFTFQKFYAPIIQCARFVSTPNCITSDDYKR